MKKFLTLASILATFFISTAGAGSEKAELIFKKNTVWKFLLPDHKLATYAIDDPQVEGVACHFTVPEKGGFTGLLGVAEELSNVSLACRQVGAITIKAKFRQGDEMFEERRSILFKRLRIVRGCDAKRNVLVYVVYSDKLIDGSPENSTSTVPIMPWGAVMPVKCGEWVE